MESDKPKRQSELQEDGEKESKSSVTITAQLLHQVLQFESPLPDPKILKEYEDITSGSAERILKLTEEQARHRQELEKMIIKSAVKRESRGQWFGLIFGFVAIISGITCVLLGHDWAGATIAVSGIGSLAAVFVIGKKMLEYENNK